MHHTDSDDTIGHDPYAAMRSPDFRLFLSGNLLATLGMQMQGVAVGWEIYGRTGSKMALGLVGLIQFFPVVALALVTGHVADRFDRKRIVMASMVVIALTSVGLAWISIVRADPRWMFVCLFIIGVARAFHQPARASLVPQLVPSDRFSNAVAWNTGGFHLACVLGPAVGGQLIALADGASVVYVLDAVAALGFFCFLLFVRSRPVTPSNKGSTMREFAAGFGFVRSNQIVLAAISLDMFAVLFGGATTLLPVFAAKEMLDVGARGLGWMRSAPAIGALMMSIILAYRPPLGQAGKALLWSIVGFGVAIICFGLSKSLWLSLVMLFLTGAFDNVSVVVRHTLVQILTPDELRGRVSAVNGLFIGASNELGGFESGLVAHFFGPLVSVVSGGIGTLIVVAIVAIVSPRLRKYGKLGT